MKSSKSNPLGTRGVQLYNSWQFYNNGFYVPTSKLGEAPYEYGFGLWQSWLRELDDAGLAFNYDVYITNGVTYYSQDCTAPNATAWYHGSSAPWHYYDGSFWKPLSGGLEDTA